MGCPSNEGWPRKEGMDVIYALPISLTSFIDGSLLKAVAFELPGTGYSGTYYITETGHGYLHLDFSDYLVHTEYFPDEQFIKDYLQYDLLIELLNANEVNPFLEVE